MKRIFLKIIVLTATLAVGNAHAMDVKGWYIPGSQTVVDTYNHYRYGSEIHQNAQKRREALSKLLEQSRIDSKMQCFNNELSRVQASIEIEERNIKRINAFEVSDTVDPIEQMSFTAQLKAQREEAEKQIKAFRIEKAAIEINISKLWIQQIKHDPNHADAVADQEQRSAFSFNRLRYFVSSGLESLLEKSPTDVSDLRAQHYKDKLALQYHILRVEDDYSQGLIEEYDDVRKRTNTAMKKASLICVRRTGPLRGTCLDEIKQFNAFLDSDVQGYARKYAKNIDNHQTRASKAKAAIKELRKLINPDDLDVEIAAPVVSAAQQQQSHDKNVLFGIGNEFEWTTGNRTADKALVTGAGLAFIAAGFATHKLFFAKKVVKEVSEKGSEELKETTSFGLQAIKDLMKAVGTRLGSIGTVIKVQTPVAPAAPLAPTAAAVPTAPPASTVAPTAAALAPTTAAPASVAAPTTAPAAISAVQPQHAPSLGAFGCSVDRAIAEEYRYMFC